MGAAALGGGGMILGTAGHVDHGKTSLVRALTGVDTDRLAEERRRGITIELGFAPLPLDDGTIVGVVDVPGHEAFVRTMVAGAAGVDLALLVIAADEGVMPQTREHLAILELLGVRRGVVALAKCDLVDAEWLALVRDDVRAFLDGSALADAAIVETALPDRGIAALRAEIARLAGRVDADAGDAAFRLPVDRAFSVRGTGTVVTGTVWSGVARRDDVVHVLPSGVTARVRAVHAHGRAVHETPARGRAALALVGVEPGDVPRGTTLVRGAGWRASRVLRADVALLGGAERPGPRARLRLHLGTAEVGVRVVGAWSDDGPSPVRLLLDAPIVARAGDRFVLRGGARPTTLGGGVVTDPQAEPRARRWPEAGLPADRRLALLLAEARVRGVETDVLAVRLGVPEAQLSSLLAGAGAASVQGRAYDPAAVAERLVALAAWVDAEHAAHPLRAGASVQTLRAALRVAPELADHLLRRAVDSGTVAVDEGLVRRGDWRPALAGESERLAAALLAELADTADDPPTADELGRRHGGGVGELLRHLERRGDIRLVGDRYYPAAVLDGLLARLHAAMEPGVSYTPAALRERLGLPRRLAVPLLEHADGAGVTRRQADGRVRVERA